MRAIELNEELGDLEIGGLKLSENGRVHLAVALEHIAEGLVVRGELETEWAGLCGRCLCPIIGSIRLSIDELFENDPVEGDTYQLDRDTIDLEPLVLDAIGLEMPIAPRCQVDCAGLCAQCGADLNLATCECVAERESSVWDALNEIVFTESSASAQPE